MPRPRPNGNNNLPGKPPICPPLGGRLFRRGMRSPLPKSQFSLPRPYPINVRARRALRIYYLLSFIYYLFCPAGALSSPMVHLSAISWEIAIKNTPTSPVNLYLPFISPGTLPRANKAPLGLCCRSVRKATDTPCYRPRWCTDPQHLGKLQQKNTPQLLARCLLWCTIGDSNPGPTD